MKSASGIILTFILFLSLSWAETMTSELVLNDEVITPQPSALQDLIDAASEGDTIVPPPGVYPGPVVINKGVHLDGRNQVTITGEGERHALVLYGSDITIENFHLTDTGHSTEQEQACLLINQGLRNQILNNKMDKCFFGIDLKKANENILKGNTIQGQDIDLGLRGDGLRLWYSVGNKIIDNEVKKFKDIVVWYSHDNIIQKNVVSDCRYSLHFMFSQFNLVDSNRFVGNAVGAYIMYTEGVKISNNYIASSNGPTGMAIGFKEASNVIVEQNDILYCAIGIGVDLSPFEPDSKVIIKDNRIAYNSVGIQFNSRLAGIEVTRNLFEGNIDHLAVSQNESAAENMFTENYWDTFEGFDRNSDGFADSSYEMYSYVDKIWMEIPVARFFKNTPMMEFVDFLEQLAPFSAPTLVMKDTRPVTDKKILFRERSSSLVGSNE